MKRGVAILAGALLAVACSVQTIFPYGTGPQPGSASQVVGAGGGIVTANDGTSLFIPPGALTADVTITIGIDTTTPPPTQARALGAAHALGPTGQSFLQPVCVTLSFEPPLLPAGTTEANVVVYSTGVEEVRRISGAGSLITSAATLPVNSVGYEALPTMTANGTQVTGMTLQFGTVVAAYGDTLEIAADAGDASCDADQLDALDEEQ